MNINKFLICIIIIVTFMLNVLNNSGCMKYDKLDAESNKLINIDDLPLEFTEDALKQLMNSFKRHMA